MPDLTDRTDLPMISWVGYFSTPGMASQNLPRAHFLTNIIDPFGRSALRLEYDDTGRLVTVRDANGNRLADDRLLIDGLSVR